MSSYVKDELVVLEGSPEDVGKEWGRINKKDIKRELAGAAKGIFRRAAVRKKAEHYVSIISSIAPH